jgi:hypothetical protein
LPYAWFWKKSVKLEYACIVKHPQTQAENNLDGNVKRFKRVG